jgi:hypothetical protein
MKPIIVIAARIIVYGNEKFVIAEIGINNLVLNTNFGISKNCNFPVEHIF